MKKYRITIVYNGVIDYVYEWAKSIENAIENIGTYNGEKVIDWEQV
tara:strand:- start:325 stop:462 length:138 start_codon:yes stop_codon:yes gene_type:complete